MKDNKNDNILSDYRKELSEIDAEIMGLLDERFDICWEIGGYKKENGIPVLDEAQEKKKLALIERETSENNAVHIKNVFQAILNESRNIQEEI